MKFKVGDRVRRKKDDPIGQAKYEELNGDELVVTGVRLTERNGEVRQDICLNYQHDCWFADRFELVEKANEAKKESDGKPDFGVLMSIRGLDSVALVFTYGAQKYDQFNWRKPTSEDFKLKCLAAACRHMYKRIQGEKLDKESGLPHLAHCVADVLMVLDLEQ